MTLTDADGRDRHRGLHPRGGGRTRGRRVTPPSITTTSLPDGADGSPYAVTPDVSGGTGPYTWSVSSGTLPTGLSLNPATGAINGTVSSGATSETFTVTMTDADGHTTSQVFTLIVGHAVGSTRGRSPPPPTARATGSWGRTGP